MPSTIVAFYFCIVSKMPAIEEMSRHQSIRRQINLISRFCEDRALEIVDKKADMTTYRGTPFVDRPAFRATVANAREAGADLVVADLWGLLRCTPVDRIWHCVEALDALDVALWDAVSGRQWHDWMPAERQALALEAARAKADRSNAIRRGIRAAGEKSAEIPVVSRLRGANANRRNALIEAMRLSDFVEAQKVKLPPDASLSPAALARALEDAGIPSSRGGAWTFNTAKRLIERVEKLKAAAPPSTEKE